MGQEDPTPLRLQRSRKKGSRLVSPNGFPVVCVSRPGKWGNPWKVGVKYGGWAGDCVKYFVAWLEQTEPGRQLAADAARELRGCNLACWCALPKPGEPDQCHGAVLLRLANAN
jgi:hypothetical protein